MKLMEEKPRVAFITTPLFREKEEHVKEIEDFVLKDLWHLCQMCKVCSTGGTYKKVAEIIQATKFGTQQSNIINQSIPVNIQTEQDFDKQWRQPILETLESVDGGYSGMIQITHNMIAGRINAVIHLMDWDDVAAKPDTMVLRRQANVHNVPIACDLETTRVMIGSWKREGQLSQKRRRINRGEISPEIQESVKRLEKLRPEQNVIALIAHDGMKLDMCRFVVEHAKKIVEYDAILATGTTGSWIKQFLAARDRTKQEINKVICCLSGPKGGDVQIAWAVVKGLCLRVIFFQDPMVSHAHATDILLFEQALLYQKVRGALATNPQTAQGVLDKE